MINTYRGRQAVPPRLPEDFSGSERHMKNGRWPRDRERGEERREARRA